MWEWAWESACPKEWGCRKKAQDLAQQYKTNGSTNGFENKDISSFNVKFCNCEKRIGWFDSGVEKLAAQNVASQGLVHDCTYARTSAINPDDLTRLTTFLLSQEKLGQGLSLVQAENILWTANSLASCSWSLASSLLNGRHSNYQFLCLKELDIIRMLPLGITNNSYPNLWEEAFIHRFSFCW